MNPVVVTGAGLAGLSAACHLAGRGYDDTVVEREVSPGGRAGVFHCEGFTFDTGHLIIPLDWQAQGMAVGMPVALAHAFSQTGPFRPSNVERQLPGMFFAGSGTVPGVGVPMVLISGKLAANRVTAYLREQGR